jgi:hypothetical protein
MTMTESAQEYVDAFVNNEFLKVATLTHPDVVKMNGGEEFVIEDLKAERESTAGEGLIYNSVIVYEPLKVLQYESELQAVIPVEYTMQLIDKEYLNKSYILAISKDEGKSYSFVNLMQFDDASLNEFITNLSPEITIPLDGGFTEK